MRSRLAGPRRKPAARTGGRRPWAHTARLRRYLLYLLLALLLAPPALLLVFRFVPVPLTPLMVIRLIEGEGLSKQWRALDQIAPALAYAAIAAEDNHFCAHFGFDWQALSEVLEEARAGGRTRGASTITMQTAKNLFLWPGRSLLRKGFEAWLTPQIELLWPKRRILEVYLNIAELGPGIYGAEAAAKAYFGKPAASLAPVEAALLAAVLPNPRQWSPARPTAYLERRADTILTRIQQLGPMLACADPA
jgi:monofunctional biosynthetic peptidoglycan transglycosylase